MSSARDAEFHFKPGMFNGVSEVFLIRQAKGGEDLAKEEEQIARELCIVFVSFAAGFGVYKNSNDAIAVAKQLIKNNPKRNLAVLSATTT